MARLVSYNPRYSQIYKAKDILLVEFGLLSEILRA